MDNIIDLDALVPPDVIITFGGSEIKIPPPKTVDILRLGILGQRLENAEKLSINELEQTVNDLTEQIYKCVPELNSRPLTTAQLLKLVEIISNMAIPPDAKDLKQRGITSADPKAP